MLMSVFKLQSVVVLRWYLLGRSTQSSRAQAVIIEVAKMPLFKLSSLQAMFALYMI